MLTMEDMVAITKPHNDKLIAEGRLEAANRDIERLRAWAEDEQRKRHKAEDDRVEARTEIERLRAALKHIIDLQDRSFVSGEGLFMRALETARQALTVITFED